MRCLMSMGVILPPAARNSRYSGEIGPRAHLVQPGVLQQLADARVLADAVLDEEPAAARQKGRRLRTYGADGVQAIAACNERARRFIGERGEMGVAFGNIWGVGDDEFAALLAKRLAPAAVAPVDLEAQPHRIAPRKLQRRRTRLDADHAPGGPLVLDGERDGAAAGTQIRDRPEFALERKLDQQFGFRAWDEHRGIDGQPQAVELLLAEDVSDRLAVAAARGKLGEAGSALCGQRALGERDRRRLAEPGGGSKQDARLARLKAARVERLRYRQAGSSASWVSCSVWNSLASAAISSSSSPSMMRSIL